jgi:hypothetical protein
MNSWHPSDSFLEDLGSKDKEGSVEDSGSKDKEENRQPEEPQMKRKRYTSSVRFSYEHY